MKHNEDFACPHCGSQNRVCSIESHDTECLNCHYIEFGWWAQPIMQFDASDGSSHLD
jgi:transcription elongation factor Elf1